MVVEQNMKVPISLLEKRNENHMEEIKAIMSESKRIENVIDEVKELKNIVSNIKPIVDLTSIDKKIKDSENSIIKITSDDIEKINKKIDGVVKTISGEMHQILDVLRNEILIIRDYFEKKSE